MLLRNPQPGAGWLGGKNVTFWVLIDVCDILPHIGADCLCDNECANGFFLHIHNLEAAIILSLPVHLITVNLWESREKQDYSGPGKQA